MKSCNCDVLDLKYQPHPRPLYLQWTELEFQYSLYFVGWTGGGGGGALKHSEETAFADDTQFWIHD